MADKPKHANYHPKYMCRGGIITQLICRRDKTVMKF